MLKRFDKYDKYSIITLILSVITCIYLVYRGIQIKKADDDVLILSISIISSVVSIGGLIIAVLQIFKVASNTKIYKEAYDKTIEKVTNNESISLLSKSLQQLLIIKQLFEAQSEISSRNYFNNLLLDLTFLKENRDPVWREYAAQAKAWRTRALNDVPKFALYAH
jgi:hypothetical protein